jgi:hypothetical protein
MLGVAPSGYYDWKVRPPSAMTLRHAWLAGEIAQVHKDSGGTYGTLRVTAELRHGRGIHVGKEQVHLLMRRLGIYGLPKRWSRRSGRACRSSYSTAEDGRHASSSPPRFTTTSRPGTTPADATAPYRCSHQPNTRTNTNNNRPPPDSRPPTPRKPGQITDSKKAGSDQGLQLSRSDSLQCVGGCREQPGERDGWQGLPHRSLQGCPVCQRPSGSPHPRPIGSPRWRPSDLPTGGHRFSAPLGDRHDDGWTFGQRGGRMTLWLR